MAIGTRRAGLTLLVAALTALALASAGRAATIVVNTTKDENNSSGNCSLREAILSANLDAAFDACAPGSGADVVKVPGGLYRLTIMGSDDTAFLGDLDLTAPVTISGAGTTFTVIDGNNGDRIFQVLPGVNALISGVVIQNGERGSDNGGGILNAGTLTLTNSLVERCFAVEGGGIANDGGTLSVRSSSVDANTAGGLTGAGGGIADLNGGHVTVTSSQISGNTANSPEGGGGLYEGDVNGTMTVTGSTISGNSAMTTGEGGGGVRSLGTLTMTNSNVVDNVAIAGGGLVVSSMRPVSLTGITVNGNTASADGGGIYTLMQGVSPITITRSTISGNRGTMPSSSTSPGSRGGGLFNEDHGGTGTLTIRQSTISGNAAIQGKGIYNDQTLTLTNVTIAHNESGGFGKGGGLFNALGQNAILTSVTISDNLGSSGGQTGGNVWNDGTVDWKDSIIANALSGNNCGGVALTSDGHNLESPDANSQCGTGSDPTNIVEDPLLGPLQANGGPAFTEAIAAASPARDHGLGCPTSDERGVPRPQGPACDIGAYEYATCTGVLVDIVGTSGNDTLAGTSGADGILGLAGNDTISGGPGNDGICPGAASDTVRGNDGNDKFALRDGTQDIADGGAGTDTTTGHDAVDVLTNIEVVH